MSLARRFCLLLLVIAAVACHSDTTGPIPGLNYATARFQCGPADGPATEILLSFAPPGTDAPLAPYVRIYVALAVNELGGHSWSLGGDSPAAAWYHPVITGDIVPATGGRLTITAVGADQSIDGSVDIAFPDAGRVQGHFHAVWGPTTSVCV